MSYLTELTTTMWTYECTYSNRHVGNIWYVTNMKPKHPFKIICIAYFVYIAHVKWYETFCAYIFAQNCPLLAMNPIKM